MFEAVVEDVDDLISFVKENNDPNVDIQKFKINMVEFRDPQNDLNTINATLHKIKGVALVIGLWCDIHEIWHVAIVIHASKSLAGKLFTAELEASVMALESGKLSIGDFLDGFFMS